MANLESGFSTLLTLPLAIADTTMTVATAPTVTSGRVYLVSWTTKEWIKFTGVSGLTLTGLTRNMSRTADPSTWGTGLAWIAGTKVTLVAMHDQLPDKSASNTFAGDVGFSWTTTAWLIPKSLTTTQRDLITPATSAIIYNSTTTVLNQYTNWAWSALLWNSNASTTVQWAVEISTQAQQSVGTDTGETWAPLSSPPSVINTTIAFNTWANQANNYTISASRSASAETIALKTLAWTDPTATDPIKIAFRISTVSSGAYQVRTITSAISVTIPSTATMGMTNSLPARLRLVAFDDDSGTVKLWVINTQVTWGIFPLQDDALTSATAIDTASDSAWVFYASSGFSTKPYRILGYLEYTLAAVGTRWTAPSKIQLFWPWVKKPGDTVQVVSNYTGAVATWTTTIPYDDTIPQITEGDQYMTQAITPTSAINRLSINIVANWSHNWSLNTTLALFQDATAWALACIAEWIVSATPVEMFPLILDHFMIAWTTSSTTMRARVWISWSWTYTFNWASTARKFGWVMSSWMKITEIMV